MSIFAVLVVLGLAPSLTISLVVLFSIGVQAAQRIFVPLPQRMAPAVARARLSRGRITQVPGTVG